MLKPPGILLFERCLDFGQKQAAFIRQSLPRDINQIV